MLFIVDKCARNRGQLLYLVLSRAIVSYMFNAPRRDGHRGGPKGVASPIVTKVSMTYDKSEFHDTLPTRRGHLA